MVGKSISHRVETMVESRTLVGISRGIESFQSFLGAGVRPSAVALPFWYSRRATFHSHAMEDIAQPCQRCTKLGVIPTNSRGGVQQTSLCLNVPEMRMCLILVSIRDGNSFLN